MMRTVLPRTRSGGTAVSSSTSLGVPRHEAVTPSTGEPLPAATRAAFEPLFGHDFSQVRIHADDAPNRKLKGRGALACTEGNDLYFASGRYRPDTPAGRRLLAHELAHAVQQRGGAGMAGAAHEQEADRAAEQVAGGRLAMVSAGTVATGTPQFKDEHPTTTPEAFIKTYEDWGGLNLKEGALAGGLFDLAWQSATHYDFVIEVLDALDDENQQEVAEAFFKQLKSDTWMEEIARTPKGRALLNGVSAFLPAKNAQRTRVEEIVAKGPQNEREDERKAAVERLKKEGKNVDLIFYTDYEGMDTAEYMLGGIAKKRVKESRSNAAFPMAQFDDIGAVLQALSEQAGGATNFVRELHLMGHGTEDNFGFGEHFYSSDYLNKNYTSGQHAKYMADGGTIHMEGCNVAKGEAGERYLKAVGRIFFGDAKTGYLKGNTCTIIAMGELTECGPRTLRWPADFK